MNANPNKTASTAQAARILRYLKKGNTITAAKALTLFQCSRLAARIHDLKRAGVEVVGEFFTLKNGKRVKKYKLKK